MGKKQTLECSSELEIAESRKLKIRERIYQVLKSFGKGFEKYSELYDKSQIEKYGGKMELRYMDQFLEEVRWRYC